jgi:hypothetical protein
MVDWATQDRLYPPGYQPVDIRYRRLSVDSSLPFAVATNKSLISFLYNHKLYPILFDRTQLSFTNKTIE